MPKEVFVGRRVLLRQFQEYVSAMVAEPKDAKGFRRKQRDSETASPRIALLHGNDGAGKSSLLRQFIAIADSVQTQSQKTIKVIFVDFDDLTFTRGVLPYSSGMLIRLVHSIVADPGLGIEDYFSEYGRLESRIKQVHAKIDDLRKGEWLSVSDSQGGEKDSKTAFLTWLRAEKKCGGEDLDLYENEENRMSIALVNAIVEVSAQYPILLAFDAYNRVNSPQIEQWMRKVFLARLFEKKNRVMVIISGRDKLLRQYRNEFSEELLFPCSLDDAGLSRLDIVEFAEQLQVKLSETDADTIERATDGNPLVVRQVLLSMRDGMAIDDLCRYLHCSDAGRGKPDIIVEHFFSSCKDPAVKARVVHCAMLTHSDRAILAALWNLPAADVNAALEDLSEHYSFIVNKRMHTGVQRIIRDYLIKLSVSGISSELSDIVANFVSSASALFAERLSRITADVPEIDKRYTDAQYEYVLAGYIGSLLWYRRDEVKRIVPGCFCECLLYNPLLGGKVLDLIGEFESVLSAEDKGFYSALSAGLADAGDKTMARAAAPSPAEQGMLGALEAGRGFMTPFQQAILQMYNAECAFRRGDPGGAFSLAQQCEPFVGESVSFKDRLLDDYCAMGETFLARKEYESSISSYGRAAQINPDRFEAWFAIGCSLAALQRHGEAADALGKAAALQPKRSNLWLMLGIEQQALDRHGEAVVSLATAADLRLTTTEVWYRLATSQAKIDKKEDAVKSYKKALALSPDDRDIWYDLACMQARLGRPAEAVEACRKVVALSPDHFNAFVLMGQQHMAQQSYNEAVLAFERAAEIMPQDATAHTSLGRAAFAAGNDGRAAEAFAKAIERGDDSDGAYNELGLAYTRLSRFEEASAAFEKAVRRAPDNADALINLGNACAAQKRHGEAIEAYKKATTARPEAADAWYSMGLSLHALGRFEEALEPYAAATRLEPKRQEAWFNRGIALYAIGKCEEAIESFKKTVELSPASYDSWFKMGLANVDLRKFEEAVASFEKAADLGADREEAWYNLGMAYVSIEKHDDAVSAFAKAVVITPDQYDAWYAMGHSNQECGRYKEALDSYRKALKKESRQEAWHNAGLCSYYLNDYDGAIEALSQALALAPDKTDTVYTLGLSHHANGNFGEAVNLYRRTLELAPDMANASMNLALALHASGRYGEAVEAYRRITEKQPDNPEAWYNMGLADEALGNSDDAAGAYARVVELAPDRLLAWQNMGRVQLSLERYGDAIASYSKVAELSKDNAEALNNIALASYYTGRFEESIAAYEKVLTVAPENVRAWGSMGLTYYTMGNYSKAIEASEKALSIKPDELWIQVNLALAAVLALNFDKARAAFETITGLAQSAGDLLHPLAALKELVARNPNLVPAREILEKLEAAWRKLKK
jgi:tetratricopeptide (TPR) repeat protein